jgi:hypothetical protein
MRNKKLFLDALHMLVHSWGSDTPAEALWSLNLFKEFYESETGEQLNVGEYDETEEWATRVMNAINDTITDDGVTDQGLTEELNNFKRLLK